MAAGRSFKSLVGRRRRADEEGEDEEGSVVMDDSQSEASIISDVDDDEADASTLDDAEPTEGGAESTLQQSDAAANGVKSMGKKARKSGSKASKKTGQDQAVEGSAQPHFKPMADTEAMLNGLHIEEQAADDVVDFETTGRNGPVIASSASKAPAVTAANGYAQSPAERQRREHEEYRRKRDADPAFIPNRGNFFMHDTRSHNAQTGPPIRGAWNGRGRGRGAVNASASLSPANQMVHAERAAEQTWKHDLHDTINEEPVLSKPADSPQDREESARLFAPRAMASAHHNNHQQPPRSISFSRTAIVGKAQIRVLLPGMRNAITFSEVPWKQYTRLPEHRPPLRRDKPVRISIAGHTQRYIFPAAERSFIFIPRQMRPNQHGVGRSGYQRSIGGYGYSSRRTSMYGGSVYAPSITASRRSSFASVARDNAFSPVGSAYGIPPNRPVVRLPHGSQAHFPATSTPMGPLSGHQTPTGYRVHTYPLPQPPTFRGTPTTTVHQPRPQKAISVTGIESPALLQNASVPSDSQPFQSQLPPHITDQQLPFGPAPSPYYTPGMAYQQQYSISGTPLPGIHEQVVQHGPYPPEMMGYGNPTFFGGYQQQPSYYYQQGAGVQDFGTMGMYQPQPQHQYILPPPVPSVQQAPPQQTSLQSHHDDQQQQQQPPPPQTSDGGSRGYVAYEDEYGTVHYVPSSEAKQRQGDEIHYQPASSFVSSGARIGMQGLPPTPAPDPSYYQYPPMQTSFTTSTQ